VRFSNSKDGIIRTSIRIPARLSIYDIAVHLVSGSYYSCDYENHDQYIDYIVKQKISTLFELVKNDIMSYGLESPHYKIGDEGLGELVDKLIPVLNKKLIGG